MSDVVAGEVALEKPASKDTEIDIEAEVKANAEANAEEAYAGPQTLRAVEAEVQAAAEVS